MNYCVIGGRQYDVLVTDLTEDFDILNSENAGRTMSIGAGMTLDPLGTFFGHSVTFQRKSGYEDEYDRLWDYVSTPRYTGIPVEIVHNQTTIKYDAYVSKGQRKLKRIDPKTGKVYWGEFTLKITPMKAQVTP